MPATDRRPTPRHSLPATRTSPRTPLIDAIPPSPSSSNWINANAGNIFYRPRNHVDRHHRAAALRNPELPTPLIGPRRTRPHSIHILTYPSGYVPRELRPKASQNLRRHPTLAARQKKHQQQQAKRTSEQSRIQAGQHAKPSREQALRRIDTKHRDKSAITPVLNKLLASFSGRETTSVPRAVPSSHGAGQPGVPASSTNQSSAGVPLIRSATNAPGALVSNTASNTASTTPAPGPAHDVIGLALTPSDNYAHSSPAVAHPHLPLHRSATVAGGQPQRPVQPQSHSLSTSDIPSNTTADMTGRIAAPASAYHMPNVGPRANSLMSVRSAKSAVSSLVTEVPKPVASGSGVTCSIILAEPNVFLSGFDHEGNSQRDQHSGTALLRGKLQLNVSKNIKIKAVQLKLLGRARTEWPEGIPPLKADLFEEQGLRTQVLTFYNAMNDGWEGEYGNQCTYKLRNSSANSSSTNLATGASVSSPNSSTPSLHPSRPPTTSRELKRLSLQNNQSRSFQKGDSVTATSTQVKGYKVFYPGTYDYSFELPIDHHQLETTKLQYGSVKWELHALVERAGAFKPNLHGVKEVCIVRVPDQMSLEMTEPISISRQWEDQLHYDIIISGKSFPIGSKIPVAFKLTPLAKVQVHKLKVFLTESVEYWTNDRRVTRKDPGRKILLLEKSAGKPLDSNWASSEFRTVRGGELTPEQRTEARNIAAMRRSADASRNRTEPEPLPAPTENILGDLDLGLESYWGSTEIEANVQLPTCEMMAKHKELRLHPDCSWKNVNVYHWIKVGRTKAGTHEQQTY